MNKPVTSAERTCGIREMRTDHLVTVRDFEAPRAWEQAHSEGRKGSFASLRHVAPPGKLVVLLLCYLRAPVMVLQSHRGCITQVCNESIARYWQGGFCRVMEYLIKLALVLSQPERRRSNRHATSYLDRRVLLEGVLVPQQCMLRPGLSRTEARA
jgi:hypothetical protein